MRLASYALAPLVTVVACAAEPPPTTGDDTTYVSQTIVSRGPDGAPVVHQRILSQEQATAELVAARSGAARDRAALVSQDPGCAGNSLWLFDGPGMTGNQLCLTSDAATDEVWMGGFARCVAYYHGLCIRTAPWTGAIRSYWGGAQPFYVVGTGVECLNCRLPWTRIDDTYTGDQCFAHDVAVGFNPLNEWCTPH